MNTRAVSTALKSGSALWPPNELLRCAPPVFLFFPFFRRSTKGSICRYVTSSACSVRSPCPGLTPRRRVMPAKTCAASHGAGRCRGKGRYACLLPVIDSPVLCFPAHGNISSGFQACLDREIQSRLDRRRFGRSISLFEAF
jgi:hypothetical protein